MSDNNLINYKQRLQSLGSFEDLNIFFNWDDIKSRLNKIPQDSWKIYNKNKPGMNRFGLSLFSLDGSTDGEIDLNSLAEYNRSHGTCYDELSFRTPTSIWHDIPGFSEPMQPILSDIGRSHLIKLNVGGIFPPHRDLGNSFRLISFFNCASNCLHFVLNNQIVHFEPRRLYFADTEKVHSLVSFQDNSFILVFNVDPTENSYQFVLKNLRSR